MNLQATNKFLAFLKDRFQLEEWELPIPGEWSNMGNTIGAIALRTSLLSLEQIDGILDLQDTKSEHKLFGQLAIELSFLTPREVDGLLSIQALSAQRTAIARESTCVARPIGVVGSVESTDGI